jgi:lipopolysaccharide transport system permease protein
MAIRPEIAAKIPDKQVNHTITHTIKPRHGWVAIDFKELWEYRELAVTLALREILVRYKQSALGVAWAIIQPLMTMLVFSALFGALFGRKNLPTPDGAPYWLSTYVALLPWQLFAQSVARGATSLVANQNLISKIYFPRIIIPTAPVLAALVDFAVACALFVPLAMLVGTPITLNLLALPLLVIFTVTTALAFSIWLSALNALYRDIQHAVPFIVQILFFISPVIYSANSFMKAQPGWANTIYSMNPLAAVCEGFRWSLLGTAAPDPLLLTGSVSAVAVMLITGLYFFRRVERRIADIV